MTAPLRDAVGVAVAKLTRTTPQFDMGFRSDRLINPDGPEAATLIQSQAARIAELEGALDRLDQCLVAAQHGDPNAEAIRRAQSQARSLLSEGEGE